MSTVSRRMPWGKFKGCHLDEIESSYLVWVLENAEHLASDLRSAIKAELGSRFAPPVHAPSSSWRKPCPNPALAADVVAAGLRTLAKKHHPDVGGDVHAMQDLNAVADWLRVQVPQ